MLKEITIVKNGGIVNKFTDKKENYKELMVIVTDEQFFVVDMLDGVDLTNKVATVAIYVIGTTLEPLFTRNLQA